MHDTDRMRRHMSRLIALAGACCLGLAALGPAAGGAAAPAQVDRPDVFRASATSLVAEAFLDRETLLPVPEAFRFIALDGAGTYESSNQTARASIFYPGNGIISGPNLACGTFGSQFPEEFAPIIDACLGFEYPLTVRADSLDPEGTSLGDAQLGGDDDPVSGQVVRARAQASDDASITEATMTDLSVRGLPDIGSIPVPLGEDIALDASVFTVDNSSSRTDERIDAEGRLVAQAESVLDGVRLLGGLIEIESIRSTARVVDDGSGTTAQDASLDVGDVTVAGVPAQLTDRGLVLGSESGDTGPLAQQLTNLANQVLGALDVRITTLEVEEGVDDAGLGFARVGGVLLEFDLDVQGLPTVPGPIGDIDPNGVYTGVVLFGQAGAAGIAADVEIPPFEPAEIPIADVPTGPSTDPGGAGPSTPSGSPSVTPTPERAAATPGTPPQLLVRSLLEDFGGRVGLVYLAFTLLALATCIAPRFALPARLPGVSRD